MNVAIEVYVYIYAANFMESTFDFQLYLDDFGVMCPSLHIKSLNNLDAYIYE